VRSTWSTSLSITTFVLAYPVVFIRLTASLERGNRCVVCDIMAVACRYNSSYPSATLDLQLYVRVPSDTSPASSALTSPAVWSSGCYSHSATRAALFLCFQTSKCARPPRKRRLVSVNQTSTECRQKFKVDPSSSLSILPAFYPSFFLENMCSCTHALTSLMTAQAASK